MRKIILGFALVALLVFPAHAQVIPVTSNNLSTTVASTNTFQSIQVSTNNRIGCTIQNNGANAMWVYFGPIAKATKSTSVQLAVGQSVSCQLPNLQYVIKDQVSITGTSGDAFFANFQ
jgi:hypothetical protein